MRSVPKPDPAARTGARAVLQGEVADPSHLPPGCAFHPRCPYATVDCQRAVPALCDLGGGHLSACRRVHEIAWANGMAR